MGVPGCQEFIVVNTPEQPWSLEPVFTVAEFAAAKKISKRTVWRMIAAGELQIERLSRRCVRVRPPEPERDRADA